MRKKNKIKVYSNSRKSYLLMKINNPEQLTWANNFGISIMVRDNGFSGFNSGAAINFTHYRQFLSDLKVCDIQRTGKAILTSLTPVEFEITIENYDLSGHFTLQYKLLRYESLN